MDYWKDCYSVSKGNKYKIKDVKISRLWSFNDRSLFVVVPWQPVDPKFDPVDLFLFLDFVGGPVRIKSLNCYMSCATSPLKRRKSLLQY